MPECTPAHLALGRDGAEHFPGAAAACLRQLHTIAAELSQDSAGVRVTGVAALRPLLASGGLIGRLAAAALGTDCQAVRAILFDKTAAANWSLAWHQDRTICVKRRSEVDGYGPWTIKAGLHHVAPPYELLSRMVTLRCIWTTCRPTTRRR